MNDLAKNMRARVLETLALIADRETQRKYQQEAPSVDVPAELFNQWEDCFFPDDGSFKQGFSETELAALKHFDDLLNRICEETPQELPPLEEFLETDAWRQLSEAATGILLRPFGTSAAGVAPRE
jgi:hypothetical protein